MYVQLAAVSAGDEPDKEALLEELRRVMREGGADGDDTVGARAKPQSSTPLIWWFKVVV